MAQEFVNSKIQPGKVVVFIKPTCPYCRETQEILSQFPFKQGILEFVDITATSDTEKIQDYLKQLTGARTVSLGFCPKRSKREERLSRSFFLSGLWTALPVPFSTTPLGLRRSRRKEGCAGWGRAPDRRHCSLEWAAELQPMVLLEPRRGHS